MTSGAWKCFIVRKFRSFSSSYNDPSGKKFLYQLPFSLGMGGEKRFSPSIMKRFLLTSLLIHVPFLCLQAKHHGYSWKDEPGKHLDGKDFLTKGPGGKFTHHRGIYYGFSKCSAVNAAGKKVRIDTWHCKGGYQTHEKVIESKADDKGASHTVEIAWRVDDGSIFASEKRTLSFSHCEDGSLQVDFSSDLSTKQESVTLDGDPQHAGFQFRASNEVAAKTAKQTYYVRPKDGKDGMGKTKNWPGNKDMTNLSWKAQSVVVSDRRYFTVYLDQK